MHKKGTIIQLQFDSTTSVVLLDKNGKVLYPVLYPATVLKSKHHKIEVSKEAFDNFMSAFTTSESQPDGKKVLAPDFDKWLDKQIKDDKKKPKVDTLSSYSPISSSTSSTSEEEEDIVEEIKK